MNGSSGIKEEKPSKKPSKRSQKALDKLSKKRKKRKAKDPAAPKRPLGAYFYYFKENNSLIKQLNPEFIQKEVVARIAADWKTLTDEQKEPFVELSKQDKLRYLREKEAYDEQKRKEEEEAGDEEDKYNDNNRPVDRGNKSSSRNYEKNGHKRTKREITFDPKDEKEIRLKDIVGADQLSFGSDSEELAAWSPPPLSIDDSRQKVEEEAEQERHSTLKQEHDIKNEEEQNYRNDGK